MINNFVLDYDVFGMLTSCTGKDKLRSNLCGKVHITSTYVEATDGHKAIRVPVSTCIREDIELLDIHKTELKPVVIPDHLVVSLEGINLKKNQIMSAIKRTHETNTGSTYEFGIFNKEKYTNQYVLESVKVVECQLSNSDYTSWPDLDSCWPKKLGYVITLGTKELMHICAAIERTGVRVGSLRLSVMDSQAPAELQHDYVTDNGNLEKVKYVVMPVRDEDHSFIHHDCKEPDPEPETTDFGQVQFRVP